MMRLFYLVVLVYALSACGGEATNNENHGHDHDHAEHDHNHDHDHDHHDHDHGNAEEGDGVHFGTEITPDGAISLSDVIAKISSGEEAADLDLGEGNIVKATSAKVEAEVKEVCKKAGCWLILSTGEGQEMRVVTNHEFFVNQDIVGKTVVIEGNAYESVETVEELRHYAEDEGASAEEIAAITEPKSSYSLIAKGLVVKGE